MRLVLAMPSRRPPRRQGRGLRRGGSPPRCALFSHARVGSRWPRVRPPADLNRAPRRRHSCLRREQLGNPKITGFTADISSGAANGTVNLQSRIFLTSSSLVCPRCSGASVGEVGTCDSGAQQGRACTTSGIVTVANAGGNKLYTLSPDCAPSGTAAGTIPIGLPITTGTSTLGGTPPCPGQTSLSKPGCGACGTVCAGPACNSMNAAGQCVDIKGGISQNCCANDPTTPCFTDPIVRTGSTAPPTPPFPDPTYPKTGNMTVVATYCEATSGSTLVDISTGLPGPGALVLPAAATSIRDGRVARRGRLRPGRGPPRPEDDRGTWREQNEDDRAERCTDQRALLVPSHRATRACHRPEVVGKVRTRHVCACRARRRGAGVPSRPASRPARMC